MNALDIFVFSTRRDTFGIAAVEAMVMGLPTVVSDIGPLREVTHDGTYATLFRTGNPDDLAQRLIELVSDDQRRTALGKRGREWAKQEFSIETHIARLRELYSALVTAP